MGLGDPRAYYSFQDYFLTQKGFFLGGFKTGFKLSKLRGSPKERFGTSRVRPKVNPIKEGGLAKSYLLGLILNYLLVRLKTGLDFRTLKLGRFRKEGLNIDQILKIRD